MCIRKSFSLFFLLFVVSPLLTIPAFAQEKGIPFITNFSPRDYKAESQNWCFVQNQQGIIYVGNNMGVLEYDGVNWNLISTPTVVRSLAIEPVTGRIYVGIIGDLGYLAPNEVGQFEFVSLLEKVPKETQSFNSVWKTVVLPQGVFFSAGSTMFRWDGTEIHVMESSPQVFDLGDRVVFIDQKLGQVRPKENTFELVEGGDKLSGENFARLLAYDESRLLLIYPDGTLKIYDPDNEFSPFKPFATKMTDFFVKNRLYRGVVSNQNLLGLTTLKGGIVFLNKQGEVENIVDKSVGLQSNECYTLFEDNQSNIWVGSGNGIARVELNAPITRFDDAVNLDAGAVLAVIRHKGELYAGGLGSFYLDEGRFHLVTGSVQQVWHYLQYPLNGSDTLLMVATSDGVGVIENHNVQFTPLREVSRYLIRSKKYPERVYVGLSTGLSILQKQEGNWQHLGNIENFDLEVRNIVEDDQGNLWLGTEYNGIVKISFTEGGNLLAPSITNYDTSKGFSTLSGHRAYLFDNEILSTNEDGIFKYNSSSDSFEPETQFGEQFTKGVRPVMYFIEDNNRNIWVSAFKNNQHPIGRLTINLRGEYDWNDLLLRRLPPMEVEVIYPEPNGIVWIGGTEGLFRYDSRIQKDYERSYETLIRRVILNEDSVIYSRVGTRADTQRSTIPYKFNNLVFTYAATSYDDPEATLYSHRLEGYETAWSEWASETRKEYTLPEGNYTFHVRAKNIYGVESEIDTFKFKILPPWYRSWFAYAAYVLGAIAIVWGLVYINTQRLKAVNRKLEYLVEKRTSEIREQNNALEEQKREIISQRNNIEQQKDELEKAYTNIQTLSEVGQKITSTLDFEKLIKTIYHNVNQLLDASAFGVGIYNERMNALEFKGFIEKNEELPFSSDAIDDDSKLASWCFRNQELLVINDMQAEYQKYIKGPLNTKTGDLPEAAVYVPLLVENEPMGVMTMQSFQKNAYSDLDLSIIQTLASYIAVAVDNAKAYEVITAKNASITDSIRYAETIQQAILPSRERMNEALHEYFIVYQPKDIVSGDFYWFNHVGDKIFLAVTDCTGHGVPGAFMSIVGINILNEIVNIENEYDPAVILETLNRYVSLSLRQHEVNNVDGMDVALCVMEPYENFKTKITFAGAKRPLYYFQNGELHKIEGVRKTIGGGLRLSRKSRKFESHEVILDSNSMLYLLSDGYVDQNDLQRNRFGSRRLRELLSTIAFLPMNEQQEALQNQLKEHMQGTPQRDDITIMGIRIV